MGVHILNNQSECGKILNYIIKVFKYLKNVHENSTNSDIDD